MKQSGSSTLAATATTSAQTENLHRWNVRLAVLHALQGVAILVLSVTKTVPVMASYLTLDPVATQTSGKAVLSPAMHHVWDVNLAWLVAIFFFISAAAHTVMATVYRKRYEAELKKGINRVRWIEYGVSASVMMVAIGLLSGVYDLASLLMLFGLTLVMNLLGLAMEVYNQGKREPNWLAYGIGCIAGVVPWIVVTLYLVAANVYGSGVPDFVWGIYASLFLLYTSFAANMFFQYKKKGKWASYLYGERTYMVLSLVAKTALAWQVFAGTLRP